MYLTHRRAGGACAHDRTGGRLRPVNVKGAAAKRPTAAPATWPALSSPLRLILMPFTSPSRDPRVPRRLPKLKGVAAPFGVPAASADDAALSALGRDGDGPRGGIVARTVEEREAAGDNTWGGGAEANEAEDRYLVRAYPHSVTVVAVMADARLDVVREKEAAARRPPQASSLDCCESAPVIRSARGNARKGDASGL